MAELGDAPISGTGILYPVANMLCFILTPTCINCWWFLQQLFIAFNPVLPAGRVSGGMCASPNALSGVGASACAAGSGTGRGQVALSAALASGRLSLPQTLLRESTVRKAFRASGKPDFRTASDVILGVPV